MKTKQILKKIIKEGGIDFWLAIIVFSLVFIIFYFIKEFFGGQDD